MEEEYIFLLELDECSICSVFVARINRACTSSIDFLIFENFSYIFTRVDRIGKRKRILATILASLRQVYTLQTFLNLLPDHFFTLFP